MDFIRQLASLLLLLVIVFGVFLPLAALATRFSWAYRLLDRLEAWVVDRYDDREMARDSRKKIRRDRRMGRRL